jgi:hypothetical protein
VRSAFSALWYDWPLRGCKWTFSPFNSGVITAYTLKIGAAGDGHNRDHAFSAFQAVRRSIHRILPILPQTRKPERLFHWHISRDRQFIECPLCAAGSIGRRNTGVKSHGWGFEYQRLARPFVQLASHLIQMGLRIHRQIGPARKIRWTRAATIAEVNLEIGPRHLHGQPEGPSSQSAFDRNPTWISMPERDTLRTRWVSNRTGESRNDAAKKYCDAGHWRDHMRRPRQPFQSSLFRSRDASLFVVSRLNGRKWRPTEAACDKSREVV